MRVANRPSLSTTSAVGWRPTEFVSIATSTPMPSAGSNAAAIAAGERSQTARSLRAIPHTAPITGRLRLPMFGA